MAMTICTSRGCQALIAEGDQRCAPCRTQDARAIQAAKEKDSPYNYRWAQTSLRWRQSHWECRQCAHEGRPSVPAQATDHIIPHRFGPDLFWHGGNRQSLCRTCHAAKSGDESGIPTFTPIDGRFVVTGPICGGKTSYVIAHQVPGDVVWDMDAAAVRLGWPSHAERTSEQLRRLRAMRAELVHRLSINEDPCWVIVHNARLACRVAYTLRATVVLCSCIEEERQRRLDAREATLGRSCPGRDETWGIPLANFGK